MARFAIVGGLRTDPRVAPHLAAEDDALIERVMHLWDAGHDTQAIALVIFERESAVAIALRVGRDRRRQTAR